MIVWFLISGKYRVRRYKDLSPQRRRKERNWIVKNMRERVYKRQCVTRWQVTAKSRGINWKVVHRGSNAFGKHSARSCRVGTRASIVPLSFFSTRLYTRFYTRIRIYVRFRVYILKEPLHARISFELILRILLFSMSSSTFYACN